MTQREIRILSDEDAMTVAAMALDFALAPVGIAANEGIWVRDVPADLQGEVERLVYEKISINLGHPQPLIRWNGNCFIAALPHFRKYAVCFAVQQQTGVVVFVFSVDGWKPFRPVPAPVNAIDANLLATEIATWMRPATGWLQDHANARTERAVRSSYRLAKQNAKRSEEAMAAIEKLCELTSAAVDDGLRWEPPDDSSPRFAVATFIPYEFVD